MAGITYDTLITQIRNYTEVDSNVLTTDKYTFNLGTNASVTEEGGGPTVSAGPVTITP